MHIKRIKTQKNPLQHFKTIALKQNLKKHKNVKALVQVMYR